MRKAMQDNREKIYGTAKNKFLVAVVKNDLDAAIKLLLDEEVSLNTFIGDETCNLLLYLGLV